MSAVPATTTGGALLVMALVVPIAGSVLSIVMGGRRSAVVAQALIPVGLLLAVAIARDVVRSGSAAVYVVGGWPPPLGVALRADGLSAALLITTAVIIGAVALFARTDFVQPRDGVESRRPLSFWTLLLGVWGGLNAVFLSNDLFSLFVAMELLTFAAVPLVSLDGRTETVAAAVRYLFFALLGSMLYLLGCGLLYGTFGTLDIGLLAGRATEQASGVMALALMTTGLLAKSALFPLHVWLPPAHAGAPPAASAVLSALVVKGSYFVALRLWFDVSPEMLAGAGAQLVAGLGACAIVVGSLLALRQPRLKLLIAYSTVAQIGYLFLAFGLVGGGEALQAAGTGVLTGATLQLISHACAKAAMFMAAGAIAASLGHDRVADLGGAGRTMPVAVAALAVGGLSLMGVPPSGGFWAKWLLLTASIESGRWWWALVIFGGGLLAGGYLYRVLAPALGAAPASTEGPAGSTPDARPAIQPRSRVPEWTALGLALISLLLGLVALAAIELVQVGRTAGAGGSP